MTDAVRTYLAALGSNDWETLARVLALDVERIGPYGDVYTGRDAYAQFLRTTVEALVNYELRIARVIESGATTVVELRESVDDRDERLHTDEAVIFDVHGGLITRIAVFLQTSVREPGPRNV